MPCSLCRDPHHNRRNSMCPVNVAARNGVRPSAQLRPRPTGPVGISTETETHRRGPSGPTGPYGLTGPTTQDGPFGDQLNEYLLLYKNMRPVVVFDTRGVLYNVYHMLKIPGQLTIPRPYIRPSDGKIVVLHSINTPRLYLTAIGVLEGETDIRRLYNADYPETDELYIFIPQIPGYNIPKIPPVLHMYEDHIHKMECVVVNRPDNIDMDDNTCFVCLEVQKPEHFVSTNCRHSYCVGCITQHIKSQHKKYSTLNVAPATATELPCPLCRTNITQLGFMEKEQCRLMRNFMCDEILTQA